MACTPRQMQAAIKRNLEAKTGKDLDGWVELARKTGVRDRRALVALLESRHGLGRVSAGIVADELLRAGSTCAYEEPDRLVAELYSGARAAWRPVHDRLVALAAALGDDVRVEPCKTYVPLMRAKQFAVLEPKTGGVDLGLALGTAAGSAARLRRTRSTGTPRITHVVTIASVREVDAEVKRWLRAAYDANG
ncbi:MAG: DUF4287 domain-containing protein [Myxococcales bacterium]|nr:DUF4287 domain-containing protein [Myxococcales bacterium]